MNHSKPQKTSGLLIGLFLLGLATPAAAEPFRIPTLEHGPELARLEPLVGAFQGRLTRFLPNGETLEISPELETGWSLGGAWFESRDLTELPDGTVIHNRTWMTWDRRAEAYKGAWQDNVMPGFVTFSGRWLDERTLELDTGPFELFGRPHRVVFVYTITSDDAFTVEMRQGWNDAEPKKVAEGRFERSKG